jgi:hypothetical protein
MRRGFAHLFYRLFARFGEMPLPQEYSPLEKRARSGSERSTSTPLRSMSRKSPAPSGSSSTRRN